MSTTEQGGAAAQPGQTGQAAARTDADLTIDMTFTWQNTLAILLALIEAGNGEGQRFARHELSRMATAADLCDELLVQLDILVKDGRCAEPVVLALLNKARAASLADQIRSHTLVATTDGNSITVPADLAPSAATGAFGVLAKKCSGKRLALEVCYSARGFYIGTCDDGMPFSRESAEYWPKRELAQAALTDGHWTQRDQP
jgi:hypothetical protein